MRLKVTRAFDRADIEEVHARHYGAGEYEVVAEAPRGKAGMVSQATADCAVAEGWGEFVGQESSRKRKPAARKPKTPKDDGGDDASLNGDSD